MSRRVVVVPCFNEARRFDGDALRTLLDADTGILLVDDGSTDGTRALLQAFVQTDVRIALRVLPANVGKGEAVRAGLNAAIESGARVVAYLDADLATPPTELRRLLEIVDADPSLRAALGSRVALLGRQIERRPVRHYLGRVFATVASLTLDAPIYDTQCGAKVFRVDAALCAALARPFASPWIFDVELIARLLEHGRAGVVEVPLERWHDVGGGALGVRAMAGAGLALGGLAARRLATRVRGTKD